MELSQIQVDKASIIIDRLMSHEDHLSYSSLSCFKESPAKFIEYKLKQKETTPAMLYGQMVHCLVLEPQEFEKRYLALDDADICAQIGGAKPRATKAYKEWYAFTVAEAGERTIVDTDDYLSAKIVASNVLHNRASARILDAAWEHEKPLEWEFKNFKFKGFKDGEGDKLIFDLKTCPDAEPKAFQRTLINNSYYLQAAMYIYGTGAPKDYYIIAVDRVGGVSVHQLHQQLLFQGMEEYNRLLDAFNDCIIKDAFDQSFDFWSERWDGIFVAEKPGWIY